MKSSCLFMELVFREQWLTLEPKYQYNLIKNHNCLYLYGYAGVHGMIYDRLGGVKVESTGLTQTHFYVCYYTMNYIPSMHKMRSQLVRKGLIQGHKQFHQYLYQGLHNLCVFCL